MSDTVRTLQLFLRISPARIALLRFIFEGYDGLAVVSTVDPREGIVRVWFPATSGLDVVNLLNELAGKIKKTVPCPNH